MFAKVRQANILPMAIYSQIDTGIEKVEIIYLPETYLIQR